MRVEFEEWVFDGDRRQLLRQSQPVHLSPKAFDLLGALIARRPAAISKSELKDLLWPSTFVSDANLPSLVAEIRSALHDRSGEDHYVRTVQRFGYAFCASGRALAPLARPASGTAAFALVGRAFAIPLPEGETVLGRSTHASTLIASASVSRRHARVVVANGRPTIEDLGSRNGTFVGGGRISGPTALKEGDEVCIGSVRLVLRSGNEMSTPPTVELPGD
ncbi:MAG TPA: FHA domain-containing protein [Vicinamibacteria bacterium]|nr:FHA domain-containing protein [Vicinamibacteria bacterium]